MKAMKKKLLLAAAILFFSLLFIALSSFIVINRDIALPVDPKNESKTIFEIEQGQSVQAISDALEKAGLIRGSDYFRLYLWKTGSGSKLKAGIYELSPAMGIPQITTILTAGESGLKSNETRVVIPEGKSNDEVMQLLKEAQAVPADANFEGLHIDTYKYAFLADKPEGTDLQGFLFPDTYNFFKGSRLDEVIAKMLDEFDSKLTSEMRTDIKAQGKSIYEVIILASIVEKEAGNKEEMPLIASVFHNRLKIGQALQSDATVNYVTRAGRAMPTNEDLEVDSPYNTYKYSGLPPTPICNPGIEAIKAVIYPAETDYYYFLTTQDGEQKTYFSKTYEEHLANKALHLP